MAFFLRTRYRIYHECFHLHPIVSFLLAIF